VPSPKIATWFVADDQDNATFFPQVGGRSDVPQFQEIYWRCIVCFFASSLAVNPDAEHVLYTNTKVPTVDGMDLKLLLSKWGVEVIALPISKRLAAGSVSSWGNQFYVFDVIQHHASSGSGSDLLLLDSDMIWLRPVDELVADLGRFGALTYELGDDEHPLNEAINGQSRAGLALFAQEHGLQAVDMVPYCGGEFYAATAERNAAVARQAEALWADVLAQGQTAPREEAHLLSVIYALEGIKIGTGNRYIRRMWTTFRHNNLRGEDEALTLWHLPSEKRTGFRDLFQQIAAAQSCNPRSDGPRMGLDRANYARMMGFPRRRPFKLVRDLWMKVAEKLSS